jgi:hypothetical protein
LRHLGIEFGEFPGIEIRRVIGAEFARCWWFVLNWSGRQVTMAIAVNCGSAASQASITAT